MRDGVHGGHAKNPSPTGIRVAINVAATADNNVAGAATHHPAVATLAMAAVAVADTQVVTEVSTQ